tara:strand:+ start:691 stop:1407 length:717 start_codon:yes stop_codon:yes gene_type:complete
VRFIDNTKKPVLKCARNGLVLKRYSSAKEVKADGFCSSSVSQACRGVIRHHKNLIWKYAETPEYKRCTKCNNVLTSKNMIAAKRNKNGCANICKVCKQLYYENNKEKVLSKCKEYRDSNKNKIKQNYKKWYKQTKNDERYTKRLVRQNEYRKLDKYKSVKAANETKRRANKLNATPAWADFKKIEILYKKAKWLEELTGLKYHVDHIVPLKGKNVCGLHVWNNLQILEASINCSKGNR